MTIAFANPEVGSSAVLLENIKSIGALLDDLEGVRKANASRIGALERRHGYPFPHLTEIAAKVAALEHDVELELKRFWRQHPLYAWSTGVPGIKDGKLIARLIAEIGDPSLRAVGHWEKAELPDGTTDREWVIDGYEERTAAQLRAYCGHGDPERSRIAKDATQAELFARGNPNAKVRAYLIGAQFKRTVGGEKSGSRSPYRDLYEQWRARYEVHVHAAPCVRCGPSGHPAPAGSPWSKAHQDAAAIRNVTKAFLNDLWAAARVARGLSAAEAA